MLTYGTPHPTRVGVYFVGFRKSFYHKQAKHRVYPKHGTCFPIWKKLDVPPPLQLTLV